MDSDIYQTWMATGDQRELMFQAHAEAWCGHKYTGEKPHYEMQGQLPMYADYRKFFQQQFCPEMVDNKNYYLPEWDTMM